MWGGCSLLALRPAWSTRGSTAHSAPSGRLVCCWVCRHKVCVHASKSGDKKVTYRQRSAEKDKEQSIVIRQLVARGAFVFSFSQQRGTNSVYQAGRGPLWCLHPVCSAQLRWWSPGLHISSSAAANVQTAVAFALTSCCRDLAQPYCPMLSTCNILQQQDAVASTSWCILSKTWQLLCWLIAFLLPKWKC